MIASDNQYLSEATQVLYEYNADKIIRQKCQAREENERYERMVKRIMQEQADALAEKDAAITELNTTIAEQNTEIQQLRKSKIENQFETMLSIYRNGDLSLDKICAHLSISPEEFLKKVKDYKQR